MNVDREPTLWDEPRELCNASALLSLMRISGIGPVKAIELAQQFSSWTHIAAASPEVLKDSVGKSAGELAYAAANPPGVHEPPEGVQLLSYFDDQYPAGLRSIPSPPAVLWVRGSTPADHRCVAVVGTRRPTRGGIEAARASTEALVAHGCGIVSGLAAGIDTVAHTAALDSGGLTWAYLGGGIDRPTPRSNAELAERIVDEGGGLLSEQPLGTEPAAPTLVARDRLQSGSSQTTVIVQSGVPSGTLHTARFTLEQGRRLFVQAPDENESGDPAWEANRKLVDPEGCDPKILRPNSDRLRRQIAERRPVADLVFADPSQLVEGLKGR